MAGNILYIPYTIFLIIALIILGVILRLKKGQRATKIFLIISIPIFILFQLYFWNLEINNYVKSYLFPSKVFECEYEEELKDLSIPLPKRTVLKGKEDFCSPFYSTYVNDREFKSFYQKELKVLKNRGEIQRYKYIERQSKYSAENKGFIVKLSSGSKIDIFNKRYEGSDQWLITINYRPKN